MHPDQMQDSKATSEEPGLVSGRFLSDLFNSLERHGIPATQMLGDLPIPIDESGRVTQPIEWADFADFMKRLEHHVGGPEGLEACGERIGELKPARTLQSLAGFSASPYSLYRAASLWALRRAIPGVETRIEEVQPNRLEIRVRLKDGLRPCPQIFHLLNGGARTLPRILGMGDAVVTATVGDFESHYLITVPSSRTLWARCARIFRALFSTSSVLQFLEAQQLELHAKHEALQKTHAALAESERRYRAITDTAVDVLCELNEKGQVEYVSPSIEDLMGYSQEQVTGSHFSLWIPGDCRDEAKKRFDVFISQPIEEAITRMRIKLHTESGGQALAVVSLRSYRTPEGELRMVGILRDETNRRAKERPIQARQEQGGLNALRSKVESLRLSDMGHPIGKSLAVLLATLESNPSDGDAQNATPNDVLATNQMTAATDRMTLIVESAMARTRDPSSSFRWLETKKLIDTIDFEFCANRASAELELRIDVSNAPPLVWGEERLFTAALGSLIDWAAEGMRELAGITLQIQWTHDRASVEFSVSSSLSKSDDQTMDPARSKLALATAEHALRALGGELVLPEESAQRPVCRIQLPQPQQPQMTAESVSTPSFR
jgi:PAS domain S-box-containing protein